MSIIQKPQYGKTIVVGAIKFPPDEIPDLDDKYTDAQTPCRRLDFDPSFPGAIQ
ncbi:MAG: hypothetical protein LBK99_14065 [Opitutaceae bacterium]|nr:hypothetical protein [Opitutaceae bacterium]